MMPVTPIEADIILYKGTDFLSRAIEFFDDSPYSHASIRLDIDEVAECLAFPFPGLITRNTVANSMDVNHSNQVLVRRMKNRPSDMSPVTSRAKFYLQNGNTYAYFQIAQLAFLTLTRKLFVVPILYDIARAACDIAAKALDSSGDRKPMICSEFVNRCFHEAAPVPNPYALFNQRRLPSNRSKFTLFSWAEGELRSGRNLAKLEEIAPNEPPSIKELESYIEKYGCSGF
jgi:hypothetical protein